MKKIVLLLLLTNHSLFSVTPQEKLYKRAEQLFKQKEYKKSQYFLLSLIKWYKQENNRETYFLLAETFRKTGNYDQAITHYDEYLDHYEQKQNPKARL